MEMLSELPGNQDYSCGGSHHPAAKLQFPVRLLHGGTVGSRSWGRWGDPHQEGMRLSLLLHS